MKRCNSRVEFVRDLGKGQHTHSDHYLHGKGDGLESHNWIPQRHWRSHLAWTSLGLTPFGSSLELQGIEQEASAGPPETVKSETMSSSRVFTQASSPLPRHVPPEWYLRGSEISTEVKSGASRIRTYARQPQQISSLLI